MTYGDLPLDAPEKPNKGKEGGACNRRACQAEPALWWNHGSYSWYCEDCAIQIGQDPVNKRDWEHRWQPKVSHPMFETREQINARMESITFDSDVSGDVIHEKLDQTLKDARRYFALGSRGAPPIRNRDRPAPTYEQQPESRQVRRARERLASKRA